MRKRKPGTFRFFSGWFFYTALCVCLERGGLAWDSHGLITRESLAPFFEEKDFPKNLKNVTAESLESFLRKEGKGLQEVLAENEKWAQNEVPFYSPLPDFLKFNPLKISEKTFTRAFFEAIRVNPEFKTTLYLHRDSPLLNLQEHSELSPASVTLIPDNLKPGQRRFVKLKEGEKVSSLEVLASASDEPDYGLDLKLWADNGTEYGKIYQWGKQPFGNPRLEFSSQAPFHMGFYHESSFLYLTASFLRRTYPEYRVATFMGLSRYALKSGHPYWAFRFAGWGLHYIQDLTQPYHASVIPGVGTLRMIGLGLMEVIGVGGPRQRMTQLITNRHFALENYQYYALYDALSNASLESSRSEFTRADGVLRTLRESPFQGIPPFQINDVRGLITQVAFDKAPQVPAVLESSLPRRLVSDPQYLFGTTEPNINIVNVIKEEPKPAQERMENLLSGLLRDCSTHSKRFFKALF